MAIAVIDSDTLTADGSEQTLVTDQSGKTCVLWVDMSNMVLIDATTLRIYVKVLSGSSYALFKSAQYTNVVAEPATLSIPVPASHDIKCTLEQTAGTNRDYDWELQSLD